MVSSQSRSFALSLRIAVLASVTFAGSLQSQGRFVPAQYRGGELPQIQARAIGGGEVFLEVSVTENGLVDGVKILRATPPFTAPLVDTVRHWRFAPAEEEIEPGRGKPIDPRGRKAVRSKVLVGGVYRPPTINTPTFGEPPKDAASPAEDVPFPVTTSMPQYPPRALFDGVVLIEMRVGTDGRVRDARIVQSAAGFDEPALEAASRWQFQPARVRGRPVERLAYVTFAFRQPVTTGPIR